MAKKPTPQGKIGWIAGCAALLGLVACGWAFFGNGEREEAVPGLPHALTVEGIAEAGADPGTTRAAMRKMMEDDTLTDEQRRSAQRNLRSVWRGRMKERVDEYFAVAEDAKEEMLDKHIDELQARMQEWRQQSEDDDRREEEREKLRERMLEMRQSRSQEERKADSESRNPDDSARAMEYFSSMRQLMDDRGLELPGRSGGGSGRGGGGSGRGRP